MHKLKTLKYLATLIENLWEYACKYSLIIWNFMFSSKVRIVVKTIKKQSEQRIQLRGDSSFKNIAETISA